MLPNGVSVCVCVCVCGVPCVCVCVCAWECHVWVCVTHAKTRSNTYHYNIIVGGLI